VGGGLNDYDESVDLIYLDPPFNSNRSYNVLFRDESGEDAQAQKIKRIAEEQGRFEF